MFLLEIWWLNPYWSEARATEHEWTAGTYKSCKEKFFVPESTNAADSVYDNEIPTHINSYISTALNRKWLPEI